MSVPSARLTNLHPRLWAPYSIVAYPYGFHAWPEEWAEPVWEPHARVFTAAGSSSQKLGECATLDDALAACWEHLVKLGQD